MGLWPTRVTVTLSGAKDLQFRSEANQCRFFASLRMTDFQESRRRRGISPWLEHTKSEIPRSARNDNLDEVLTQTPRWPPGQPQA